jgi:hypothetical protein
MIDEALKQWATARQIEYIDAVNSTGSARAAARLLNTSDSAIRESIQRLKKKAAVQGYSPEHDLKHIIPEPFVARGHSTYYDQDGKPTQQWVKTRLDDKRWFELLQEVAAAMSETLPRIERTAAPQTDLLPELCNQYTLTDVHLGMLAWHEEGGANWDVKIAEKVINSAFMNMIERSPAAESCVIAQLGDWFHSDGLLPVTPGSGHVLDQDGRYSKIVRAGVRMLRNIISQALLRHGKVKVLLAEGNHDESGSIWLREMFSALYENEPRVEVITTQLPFYAVQHGSTALFYHHGHKKKIEALPGLFAALFPEVWGATKKRYVHTGHMHHHAEKEHPGVKVTQHPTLAARDAYSARGGWLSERQASCITYHAEFGEVARTIVTPEMLG